MEAIRYFVALCGVLALAASAPAGPPQAPRPPQAPPVEAVPPVAPAPSHLPAYTTAYHDAVRQQKCLVIHVGPVCAGLLRGLPECLHCSAAPGTGWGGPGVVALRYYGGDLYRVGAFTANCEPAAVRAVLFPRVEEGRAAAERRPFFGSPPAAGAAGAAEADVRATGPWLPDVEQVRLRRLLPKGVPAGRGLRFFRSEPRYQKLVTTDGGQPVRDVLPVTGEVEPWLVSGGMVAGDKGRTWTNATGLDLPDGSLIDVWEEWTDVGAFGPVPRIRWRFPEGTAAYDVLMRRQPDGTEQVFEVRVHEKGADRWDGGTVYRPKVDVTGWTPHGLAWHFPVAGIGARATVYPVPKLDPDAEFVASRTVAVDRGGLTPPGYAGTGTSCNTCHNRTGERTGYGEMRRGDDGRFSWHPWRDDVVGGPGVIDTRRPVRVGRLTAVRSFHGQ